jgi:hypothetical protein
MRHRGIEVHGVTFAQLVLLFPGMQLQPAGDDVQKNSASSGEFVGDFGWDVGPEIHRSPC